MVRSVVAPGVLHDEVFLAVLVFGQTVDHHAVVVGGFPVVVTYLAHFLCDGQFALVVGGSDGVAFVAAGPAGSVAARLVIGLRVAGNDGDALACVLAEAVLAAVSARRADLSGYI